LHILFIGFHLFIELSALGNLQLSQISVVFNQVVMLLLRKELMLGCCLGLLLCLVSFGCQSCIFYTLILMLMS